MSDHYFIDDEGNKIKADDFSRWFLDQFDRLTKGQDKLVSQVILYHLIIERHIEIYIQKNNPNLGDIRDRQSNFSFNQKLGLIKTKDESVKNLLPGIRKINEIRNKYAHNLGYKLTLDDLNPLIDCLARWHGSAEENRKQIEQWEPTYILMGFSMSCCSSLQLGSMKFVGPNLFDKLLLHREEVKKHNP